jgi:tetratricopeptide (TPR) repeat protein
LSTVNSELIKILEHGFSAQQGGDLDAAEKNYRRVLAEDPDNEFALNLLGVVLIKGTRHAQAIEYLQHAAAVNPSDAETRANLGLAYVGLHRYEEAMPSPTLRQRSNCNHASQAA